MERMTELLLKFGDLPIAYLAIFLGFGGLALAAYAIHAVSKGSK